MEHEFYVKMLFSYHKERTQIMTEIEKIMITLSGGGLVLSMTVLSTIFDKPVCLRVLIASWIFFGIVIVSIICNNFISYRLRNQCINNLEKAYRDSSDEEYYRMQNVIIEKAAKNIECLNFISLFSFLVAIILLGLFVFTNVNV